MEQETFQATGTSTTRIQLKEPPAAVDDVRVTLLHSSGKRVDVANRDLTLEGDEIELSGDDMEKYADLYRDEGEDVNFTVEVELLVGGSDD